MAMRDWACERAQMVSHLRTYGVRDPEVLRAMGVVERHRYIPASLLPNTPYGDHPCSIGHGQTISQPYIVAHMIETLNLRPGQKVLEVGAGCGYQTAILAEMGMQVYAIEIIAELADHARRVLSEEGYADCVRIRTGDGYAGWPEFAPYDGVIGACAPPDVPEALPAQLAEGGTLILPVGRMSQDLIILQRRRESFKRTVGLGVRFVPMVGGPQEV